MRGTAGGYREEELKPISALQHLVFCERRCALIHLEGVWEENAFTAEGEVLHERVHEASEGLTAGVRHVTGLPVRSIRLGLVGQCDVVEFRPGPNGAGEVPYPVEYKRGTPRRGRCDEVQICAQALCLEEMLGRGVPAGAIYYAAIRRRKEVEFGELLRMETERWARRLHELLESGSTPAAKLEPKCRSCSLISHCVAQSKTGLIERYLRELYSGVP